MIMDDAAEKQM